MSEFPYDGRIEGTEWAHIARANLPKSMQNKLNQVGADFLNYMRNVRGDWRTHGLQRDFAKFCATMADRNH